MNTYLEFRGKCKELSEAAVAQDPTLTLVRGHYVCPFWGEQEHWWCVTPDGAIVDPSVAQFPTKGAGADYVPFDGTVKCARCGKTILEDDAMFEGNYAFCSPLHLMRFVGL